MRITYTILEEEPLAKVLTVEFNAPDLPNNVPMRQPVQVPVVNGALLSGVPLVDFIMGVAPVPFYQRLQELAGVTGSAELPPAGTTAERDLGAPVVLTLDQLKDKEVRQIDRDYDAIVRDVIGQRGEEYRQAYEQAIAFQAANYAGPVPSYVASWQAAKVADGWSAQMAAEDIISTGQQWKMAEAQIRAQRLPRKEQIRRAASPAGVNTAVMNWRAFVANVRGALGVPLS